MSASAPPPSPDWKEVDKWIARPSPLAAAAHPAAALSNHEVAALIDDCVLHADRLTAHWFRDHWPDCLLAFVAIVWVSLAFVQQSRFAPVDQLQINVRGGLSPFHVITDADLVARRLAPSVGGIRDFRQARGRYLLQYVPNGAVLRDSQLSRGADWDARLQQRSIVEIPVRVGPLEPPRESSVTLLGAPRMPGKPAGIALADVSLLSIRRVKGVAWASLAVTSRQLQDLQPLLGNSDFYLARAHP